ncbi:hypothetical protein [Lederbergia citrea]|uniref:hypothetical protein n=1 Tax=Lederbergia citrea TaxID=2833581 RepID=UPI002016A582|nr:hypothetical protein [Lederbergia citrea]
MPAVLEESATLVFTEDFIDTWVGIIHPTQLCINLYTKSWQCWRVDIIIYTYLTAFGISVMIRFYRTDWNTIKLKMVESDI